MCASVMRIPLGVVLGCSAVLRVLGWISPVGRVFGVLCFPATCPQPPIWNVGLSGLPGGPTQEFPGAGAQADGAAEGCEGGCQHEGGGQGAGQGSRAGRMGRHEGVGDMDVSLDVGGAAECGEQQEQQWVLCFVVPTWRITNRLHDVSHASGQ